MEVTLAFLADAANVGESGKLNVLGIFNSIFSDAFPYRHPLMYCVVRFSANPSEFGKEKDVEVALLGPDGKKIGTLQGKAIVPTPTDSGRAHVELILGLHNVPFEHPGPYNISILAGGDEKWSIPLEVVQRKAGDST